MTWLLRTSTGSCEVYTRILIVKYQKLALSGRRSQQNYIMIRNCFLDERKLISVYRLFDVIPRVERVI